MLELDSIEFFSLSRTLIIVPKDYDKYHITEAINLIKDLEFIEFIDANKVYQTIQIPNTVIYRSDNYIDHYNTLEDNINGFLDTIKKYEFPNGFSDLSWNNKVEYILNNDIYLPEMMKKLIKSNKYIIILNDFEYEYIDLDIF